MAYLASDPNYIELEHLRQQDKRIFADVNDYNKRVAIISSSYCCYKNEEGKFDLIDLNLDTEYNNYIGSTAHDHSVYFRKSSKGIIAIFGYGTDQYYGYQLPDDANDVPGEFDGHKVIYRNIYDGIDVEFENMTIGITKRFIVRSKDKYRDVALKIIKSKVDVKWNDEIYGFTVYDKTTGEQLWIGMPIAIYDSAVVTPAPIKDQDLIVNYTAINNTTDQLDIMVSEEYRNRCKFPLYIDPETNKSGSFDHAYQSSYSSSEYPYGATGVVTSGGKYIGRWCIKFDVSGLGATSITQALLSATKYYDANYGGGTYARRINTWANQSSGWGNRPSGFQSYEDSGDVGWWMTQMCKDWMLNGVANLGVQVDSYEYENQSNYAWKKYYKVGSAYGPNLNIKYETNTAPTTPTNVGPSTGVRYVSSIPVSWTASTDAQNNSLTYDAVVQKNDGGWVTVQTGLTGTSFDYDISGDAEGTKYLFAVKANDGSLDSGWGFSGTCYKNISPSAPTTLTPNSGIYESKISLAWGGGSDSDNHNTLGYDVYVSVDDGGWTALKTYTTSTSYDYDISGHSRGTKYKFKVCTSDGLQISSYKQTSEYCYRNSVAQAPTISSPVNNSTVYDKTPRVLINVIGDPNAQGQTVYVSWGGTWYNSKDNIDMFSRTGSDIKDSVTLVFRPKTNQEYGSYKVKAKVYDGMAYSDESTEVTINIADPKWTDVTITADTTIIKADHLTELMAKVNNIRSAYGLNAYDFTDDKIVVHSTFVTANQIIEARAAIDEARKACNDWHSTDTFDVSSSWSTIESGNKTFVDIKFLTELRDAVQNI